jgi:hypothetical protein
MSNGSLIITVKHIAADKGHFPSIFTKYSCRTQCSFALVLLPFHKFMRPP